MIKKIDFDRKEIFKHYHECNNPFLIITVPICVTNVVNFCHTHRHFYATMGYLITKSANLIDAFKYRYKEGEFYFCDRVISNYTQIKKDGNIGYYDVPDITDYDEYIKVQSEIENEFINRNEYSCESELNEIWLSCAPWFSYTGLITPFNKEVTIPQFIWDKYTKDGDNYTVHLTILVHHGFADGLHIAKFIDKLNENISSLK